VAFRELTNDMHCRDFESRLNDILDDRGQPRADAQLAEHAAQCDPCRALLDGQQALFAGLAHRPLPAPAAGFARRIALQVAPDVVVVRGASTRRVWWAVATVLSTAAAVLLVVSLVWQARRGAAPQPGDAVVNAPSSALPTPHRAPPGGLAVAHGDWLIEAPRFPSRIRGTYHGTIDNLAVTLPETVERLDEVEHYAPGIRPIRLSLGVLLNALWRTIPGSHEDAQPSTRTSYRPAELRHVA
jgi:hypothetical protein